MKFAFFSNYLNHHQLPFCLEMYKRLGSDFVFVSSEPMEEERKALGYRPIGEEYPFVLEDYKSSENQVKAEEIARTYDAVIFGAAPEKYVRIRMKENKLSFRYCERPFKGGLRKLLNPKVLYGMLKTHTRYGFKKFYLLSAGAYVAKDMSLVLAYPFKKYKWGYFTEVLSYADTKELYDKKVSTIPCLLWAGRLLSWKHPEMALYAAKKLRESGYDFTMNIIGIGPLFSEMEKRIQEEGLTDSVHLLGSMHPEEVRRYMEESHIFLFTSDREEGWGAVLNEAMNSGCAVVANRDIGSVPYLLRDGINGIIYKNTDAEACYQKVKSCIDNPDIVGKLGKCAYETIKNEWSPSIATERILELSQSLMDGHKVVFDKGPLSHAKNI